MAPLPSCTRVPRPAGREKIGSAARTDLTRRMEDSTAGPNIYGRPVDASISWYVLVHAVRCCRLSKMGQRDLRCLLIIGAMAVVSSAVRRGETNDPWLARMLARKPRMLVAVALANKMARIVWALVTRKETYRGFAPAAA